jgi:hypothetical protein
MAAKLDASRAREELALYKLQLNAAQKEILHAQEALSEVEAQRNEAEASAAKARSKAREISERHVVLVAHEEGRRLGFEEGLRRGRQIGYNDGLNARHVDEPLAAHNVSEQGLDPNDRTDRGHVHHSPESASSRPESIQVLRPSMANNPSQEDRTSSTSAPPVANPARPPSTHTQASNRTRRNSAASAPGNRDSLGSLPPPRGNDPFSAPTQDRNGLTQSSGSRPYTSARRRSTAESTSSGISNLELVSFPNPSLHAPYYSTGNGRDRERGGAGGLPRIRENSSSPSPSLKIGATGTNMGARPQSGASFEVCFICRLTISEMAVLCAATDTPR